MIYDRDSITKITHEDGSYWDYDGRNHAKRVADRKSASGNVVAKYAEENASRHACRSGKACLAARAKRRPGVAPTCDAADNMLTKKEPFEDDFEDGAYTGWTVNGPWSASTGQMVNTADSGWSWFQRANTDPSLELRFDYMNKDTSDNLYRLMIDLRITSAGEKLVLSLHPSDARLVKYVGGFWSLVDQNTGATTTQDELYHFRAVCDGSSIKVYRWQDGELETEILSGTVTDVATTTTLNFAAQPNSVHAVDNIRILSDDLENSYTFAYNTANELTSMTGPNGTTTFTYDAWGRQTAKTLNSVTDTYAYRYGSKLYSVDLTNDSNVDVTYEYGADGMRRTRTSGSHDTWYNWDANLNVINEESINTNLSEWHLPFLAVVVGDPSSEEYRFPMQDHRLTTRSIFNESRELLAEFDFAPYGSPFIRRGMSFSRAFVGLQYDDETSLMLSAFRQLDVVSGRWTSRDPLEFVDGPNLYAYVGGNPISRVDLYGLSYTQSSTFLAPPIPSACPGGLIAVNPGDLQEMNEAFREYLPWVLTPPAIRIPGLLLKLPLVSRIASQIPRLRPAPRPLPAPANTFPRCFVAGTLVLTPDGHKPIEEIQVGDEVIGFDSTDNSTAPAIVVHTMSHVVSSVLQLEFENAVLRATAEHPFWVAGRGWVEADKLATGDECLLISGATDTLRAVTVVRGEFTVYNLSVDSVETYFVTDQAILVHNKGYRQRPQPTRQPRQRPDRVPNRSKDPPEIWEGPIRDTGVPGNKPEPPKPLRRVLVDLAADIARYCTGGCLTPTGLRAGPRFSFRQTQSAA
jgi:RHS repeat-associated protein